jgi:hypothetical protein
VQAMVKESMEEALGRIIPEVSFIVEPKIAYSWGSAPEHQLFDIGIH